MGDNKNFLNSDMVRHHIKTERKKRHIRGDDLSVLIGKGKAYISQVESGKIKYLPEDTLRMILKKIHQNDSDKIDIEETIAYLTQFDSTPIYDESLSFDELFIPITNVFRQIYDTGNEDIKEYLVEMFRAIELNIERHKIAELKLLNVLFPDTEDYDKTVIKDTNKKIDDALSVLYDKIDEIWVQADIANFEAIYNRKYHEVKNAILELNPNQMNLKKYRDLVFVIGIELERILRALDRYFNASLQIGAVSNLDTCKQSLNSMIKLQNLLENVLKTNYIIPTPITSADEFTIREKIKEIRKANLFFGSSQIKNTR